MWFVALDLGPVFLDLCRVRHERLAENRQPMQPSCVRPHIEVRNLKPCRRRHQPAVVIGECRNEAGNERDTTERARGQLGVCGSQYRSVSPNEA